jgi:hypothetical protein
MNSKIKLTLISFIFLISPFIANANDPSQDCSDDYYQCYYWAEAYLLYTGDIDEFFSDVSSCNSTYESCMDNINNNPIGS